MIPADGVAIYDNNSQYDPTKLNSVCGAHTTWAILKTWDILF